MPSSFRIAAPAARPHRGQRRPARCCCPSCTSRSRRTGIAQAAATAAEFPIAEHFPFVDGARPMIDDPTEQLLAPDVAADAQRHRRRRHPRRRQRRQRAAAVARRCSSASACRRRATHQLRSPALERRADRRPAVRRARARSATRTPAAAGTPRRSRRGCEQRARRRVAGELRQAGARVRRGRLDPVHGHARRRCSPTRSSSSPACSGPAPTPTARTSSSTCRRRARLTACLAHVLAAHSARRRDVRAGSVHRRFAATQLSVVTSQRAASVRRTAGLPHRMCRVDDAPPRPPSSPVRSRPPSRRAAATSRVAAPTRRRLADVDEDAAPAGGSADSSAPGSTPPSLDTRCDGRRHRRTSDSTPQM